MVFRGWLVHIWTNRFNLERFFRKLCIVDINLLAFVGPRIKRHNDRHLKIAMLLGPAPEGIDDMQKKVTLAKRWNNYVQWDGFSIVHSELSAL